MNIKELIQKMTPYVEEAERIKITVKDVAENIGIVVEGGVDTPRSVLGKMDTEFGVSLTNLDNALDALETVLSAYPIPAFLSFTSSSPFTLAVASGTKEWNGTIEYSTDNLTWQEWDGATTLNSAILNENHNISLRGRNNTTVTGSTTLNGWNLVSSDDSPIDCNGRLDVLLDYINVFIDKECQMDNDCFNSLFYGCSNLRKAPELPMLNLSEGCYTAMFVECTGLINPPALPATILQPNCYTSMFEGCANLIEMPTLPAKELAGWCYSHMFNGCVSLTTVGITAETLSEGSCAYMFEGCTNLTTITSLTPTTLGDFCYGGTFTGCTSLVEAPELVALELKNGCYSNMFQGCTSLITVPSLPSTSLAELCYANMFQGCTSLVSLPELPATVLPAVCYQGMFDGCTNIKLSTTQGGEYQNEFRIPISGAVTDFGVSALEYMFENTGGTVTTIDKEITYYTPNSIVR